jgi:uncharacterized protein (DUF4415 family)
MNKITKFQVDLGSLPPLTQEQKRELAIDVSDIPPLTDDFWKKAVKNPFYKPVKLATTVRVDADVLAWLKSAGKGYHTRINAILRDAMMQEVHKTS